MINGKVIQFRRGRHTYKPRHFLIEIENIDNREKTKKVIDKTNKTKTNLRLETVFIINFYSFFIPIRIN